MLNNRTIKVSFFISLSIHLLLLSIPPVFNLSSSQTKDTTKIIVELVTEKPPLLPKKERLKPPSKLKPKLKPMSRPEPAAEAESKLEPIVDEELISSPEVAEDIPKEETSPEVVEKIKKNLLATENMVNRSLQTASLPRVENLLQPQPTGSSTEKTRENFLHLIRKKIEWAKYYPGWARERGLEGVVKVEVVITKEGEAGKIKIVDSSGHKALDKAALATVKRASPFPALSKELGEELKITVPIVYKFVEE